MRKNKHSILMVILVSLLLISFIGCASAPAKKQIAENRYQIQVVQGFSGWNEWDEAARQACPDGYKVIERNILRGIPDLMVGTIECDVKSKQVESDASKPEPLKDRDLAVTKTAPNPEKKVIEKANVKVDAVMATNEPKPTTGPEYLFVTKNVNMRAEANSKSKIIANLKAGTKVEKLNVSGSWINVKLSTGIIGWVFKDYLIDKK